MTYLFKQILVPSSKYNIKSPHSMNAQYITVHNTANDASAANEVSYHNRNNNQVSYHVAIDDTEAIQCIPFNRNAWHCGDGQGDGNRKSIGIEICYSKSGGPRYMAAEENAVHYIAKLLHDYGWGIDRVKQHYEWSKKNCPHRIRDEKRWESFKKRIQAALNILKATNKEENEMVQLLNETGRSEVRELLKKGRKAGIIDAAFHTDKKIEKYSDIELLSYQVAVINRTFK